MFLQRVCFLLCWVSHLCGVLSPVSSLSSVNGSFFSTPLGPISICVEGGMSRKEIRSVTTCCDFFFSLYPQEPVKKAEVEAPATFQINVQHFSELSHSSADLQPL